MKSYEEGTECGDPENEEVGSGDSRSWDQQGKWSFGRAFPGHSL